jgi:hypothetical protein
MKLIFLNRYFYPDLSATSQMLTDLAFHLAEGGHEVHVICSRQLYESPDSNLVAFETIGGVQAHRVWTSRFGRANLMGRACDYLAFYVLATLKLIQLGKPPALPGDSVGLTVPAVNKAKIIYNNIIPSPLQGEG